MFDKVEIASEREKKALAKALLQYLYMNTRYEVSGAFGRKEIDRNNALRRIELELLRNTGLDKEISPEEALSAGIVELVPEFELRQWADSDDATPVNKLFHIEAVYFLQKIF